MKNSDTKKTLLNTGLLEFNLEVDNFRNSKIKTNWGVDVDLAFKIYFKNNLIFRICLNGKNK